jgi:hypothetical protein
MSVAFLVVVLRGVAMLVSDTDAELEVNVPAHVWYVVGGCR